MNEESRPARRLPTTRNSVGREVSTHYGRRDREHELDRMVAAATWRAERAKRGAGYVFKIPSRAQAA
jgi:hypothetical protein